MHVQTVEDVMQPFMHYPKVIQQAVLRVETHPSFSSLTRSHKNVLKWLVSRARASNAYEPIKARLDTVSEQASISYKTVQRAMLALNDIAWVVRITDGRGEFGVFAANQYRLTEKLCQLIGLPYADTSQGQGSTTSTLTAQQQDASDPAAELHQFYERSIEKDRKEASAEQRDHTKADLPAELREITAFGVNEFGVCRLRGHAYARGHKLEHIWAIAKARLQEIGAKGGRVYRYLIAMIVKDADYAARASQETRIAGEKPQAVIPVAKAVQQSRDVADQVVQQAIAILPKGRAANINAMRALLGKGRAHHAEDASEVNETDHSSHHTQPHSQDRTSPHQHLNKNNSLPIETAIGHKCPTALYIDL